MENRIINEEKIKEYKTYLIEEEKSSATVEKYTRDVRVFLDFIGSSQVCKQRVMEYKQKLGASYAPASANSMIAALNSFFRFCGWSDICVKQFRIQRDAYCAKEKELTREEYMRLLAAADKRQNHRLNLIIQTICGTGIRVSELQYITVEALNKGEAVVNCKGKIRRVFIVSQLKNKLLRYAKEQQITKGTVFVTRKGKPISRNSIWRDMKSLCRQAQVSPSKVFPHNLRHLFARTFYCIEKDIIKLADILGHASVDTTRIYIVSTGEEHRRKIENMRLIL